MTEKRRNKNDRLSQKLAQAKAQLAEVEAVTDDIRWAAERGHNIGPVVIVNRLRSALESPFQPPTQST